MYPVLFEIPGFDWPIFSYGVMLGLSIIIGWYLTLGLAERDGLPRQVMGSCYFWGILGALLGARLLYVITNPGEIERFGDLFAVREGGLVAYGGFLGGLLGSAVYCRIKRIRLLAWADATAPPIALGLAITRVGCFLNGCCYGRVVTEHDPGWLKALAVRFPNWAVRFPDLDLSGGAGSQGPAGAPAFLHHVEHLGLESTAAASLEVIPTQIIASINGLIAFGLVMLLRRYRRFRGMLFLSLGAYYGLTRFFLEIIRDDTQRGTMGPAAFGPIGGFEGQLTTSQVIALATVAVCAAGMIFLARRARRDPEAAMALGPGAAPPRDDKTSRSRPRRSKKSGGKGKKR